MDPEMLTNSLLKGVLLPGAISLALFWVGWAGAGKTEQARGRAWVGALAVGLAVAAAYILTLGWPGFPPTDTTRWLPFAALLGAVLGLIAAPASSPWGLTALLRLAASVALPLAVLQPTIRYTWQESAWLWIGGIALALFVLWTTTDIAARRLAGPAMPLSLGAATALLAVALVLGRSAMLAQAGGMLAAAVGAAFLVALWRPHLLLAFGAMPVFMLVYAALLLSGHFFAELPALHTVLLALAPAATMLAAGIPAQRRALRSVVALLLALVLAGTAAGLLYNQQQAPEADTSSDSEYELVW
jgi:hypothetical protein